MNIIIKILCSSLVLVVQMVKNLPAMQETWVPSLDQEDPLEKGMATQTNILAWRIPWTEEPGRLQSIGLQRIGHDWVTHARTHTRTHTHTHTHTHTWGCWCLFHLSWFQLVTHPPQHFSWCAQCIGWINRVTADSLVVILSQSWISQLFHTGF